MESMIGQTLGQYQVVEQIGKGGMATVYKAFQPSLNRYVAIKILPAYYAHEPGFAERFTREAQAIAQLDHPHILPVHDFGKQGDISYIVMKYVPAGTLRDQLGRPLAPAKAVDTIEQIASALDFAHQRGIYHRDVKPGNILVDHQGWIYLSDFGLAKMVESSVQLTGSGVGVGTPAYMSPEQGQGLPVDGRTDIYALGIILFEMLTGQVPYEAETPMAIVIKHITAPIPMPRQLNPHIPAAVERVLLKAMAKNREDRFASAGDMAAALRQAVQGLEPHIAAAPIQAEAAQTALHRPLEPLPPSFPAAPQPAAGPLLAAMPPQRQSFPWLPLLGGLGVMVVAGLCVIAGWFYYNQQAAIPTPTPLSVSPLPTFTPVLAVSLPTPTPSAIPSPTLAPTAAPTPGSNSQQDQLPPVEPATSTFTPLPPPTFTPTGASTPTPEPPPTFTPTFTPVPASCASEPQGLFRSLWLKHKDRLGCPEQVQPVSGFYAEQPFQNGHMFWSQLGRFFLIVIGSDQGAWRFFPEDGSTWKEGMPSLSCQVEVPPGLVQPVRGFGGLWCAHTEIRDKIGWGLSDERGFEDGIDLIQGFEGGMIFRDSDGQTRGVAYVLFKDDLSYVREGY